MSFVRVFLLSALLFIVGGCANTIDYSAKLQETKLCCADLTQIKPRSLKAGTTAHLHLGSGDSPKARQFPGGPSFFELFELPEYSGAYEFLLESTQSGSQIVRPQVVFLDKTLRPVKTLPPSAAKLRNQVARHNFFVNKDLGYRYIMVYVPSRSVGENSAYRSVQTQTAFIGTGYWNYGTDQKATMKTAAGGSFKLTVKPYKPKQAN